MNEQTHYIKILEIEPYRGDVKQYGQTVSKTELIYNGFLDE